MSSLNSFLIIEYFPILSFVMRVLAGIPPEALTTTISTVSFAESFTLFK